MRLSEISVKRPVAVTMLFLILILLGSVSVGRLNMDLLPELDLPMAMAMTNYPGVGPDEMENLVTRPIEGIIGTVNGIKNINSTSSQGSSVVFVEFAWGTDMSFAINQMREKLDLIVQAFPDGVEKPVLFKLDPNMMPVMVLGFAGDTDLATLDKLAKDTIQPNLERVNGVATVWIEGGVKREIRISVVPQKLQAYGLTLDRIVSYLRMENRNASAGTVEEGLKEHVVRVTGEFKDITEIENIKIPLSTGGFIRLAELAKVEDTFKDKKEFVYMDGVPCVTISIQKQTDANTVKVSDAVLKKIEEIKKQLPKNTEIKVGFNQASYIKKSVNSVTNNAISGGILAVFVLLLFLRNFRSTLVIGAAIPISIIATFILMYFAGLTLNLVSMGGLALGVGMMVDNAIVILENIYRHRQEGYSRIEAAIKGANEVGVAITASTLTTVVVFLPIVYVEGLASQIFRPLALTVTFSLISSLVMALTLVPMLSSKILKVNHTNTINGEKKGRFAFLSRLSDNWNNMLVSLDGKYRIVLNWAISNKKKVVGFTAVLVIVSLVLIPLIGMEFLPKQDSGEYIINIKLPNGTAVQETHRVTNIVEGFVHELPEHEWSFISVGSGGSMFGTGTSSERATIQGKLLDKSKRERNIDQILDELRARSANVPGAKIDISAQSGSMGVGGGNPIQISLTGDNLEVLKLFSQSIADRVKAVEGAREVKTSFETGRPELHLKLKREKADLYGLNAAQLSGMVATAVNGSTATQLRTKGEEFDVIVILDQAYRQNINDLKNLVLASPTGALISLGEVADFEMATGPTQINRINQSRRVTVTGDISGRDLRSVTVDIQKSIKDMNVPAGVQLEIGGANQDMMESFRDLGLALILAIILVYMILAAQYESLLYPFVIMFAMPPTIVGVIFGLLTTGRALSVPAFIGIIMLAGIVVNNAIVLVDYINTLRKRDGLSRKDAILKAGPTRLRPILMTTFTTILGLLPLVLGLGEGAEMTAPMATAVFGGLSFSTLITLILIPCMYIILEDFADSWKNRFIRLVKRIRRIFTGSEPESVPDMTSGEGL